MLFDRFDLNRFLAECKVNDQQDDGQYSPDRHNFNPCGLIVSEELNERQRAGYSQNAAERGETHANDAEIGAFLGISGHHGGQTAVGQVDCSVANGCADEAEVSKKTSLFLDAQAVETAEWYPGCMLSQSNEESPPHSRGKPKHSRSFQLLGMEKDHIQSILQALEEEQKRKGSGYVDMKRCYLEQMLIMLNRIRESQTRDAANCHSWKQDMVNAVLGQIEADIAAPFDFNAFAQSQGITPAYFRSIFKSIVNMSPTDYLNHVRISRALELLQVTSLSIAEIASRVGIYDANYFSRLFKKVTGYPPRYFKSIPDQE